MNVRKRSNDLNKPFGLLVLVYSFMWVGGMASYLLLGQPPTTQTWASPLFLLLAGMLVLFSTPRADWWKLAIIGLLGLGAEAIGVQSGLLFSPYQYTDVLQPQLLGVPVVMACAWVVLIAYIRQMLQPYRLSVWLDVILASLWMTTIDLVIDPLAANQLGYWRWERTGVYYGIPWHNFIGWFVTSLVIFAIVQKAWRPNLMAQRIGLSMVIFFTVIALAFKLTLACGVGAGLLVLHFVIVQLAARSNSFHNHLIAGTAESPVAADPGH